MLTNNKKKIIAVLAGLGVAVLCTGVLSAATFSPKLVGFNDEPNLTAIPTITTPGDIRLPLDTYLPTAEAIRTMQHGVYEAVANCMTGFGLDFEVQPVWYQTVSMFPVDGSEFTNAGLYGLLDAEHAVHDGYHAGPTTVEGVESARRQAEEEAESWQNLPDDYLNVLGAESGGGTYAGKAIPQGGCFQAGKLQVEGSGIELLRLYEEISSQSWTSASQDSRVHSVFAAWSECMARAGYSYQSPWEANDDRRWGTATVSQLEIETAVADVNCKMQTNLAGIYSAVQSAYERRLIEEHAGELNSAVNSFQRAVERAEAILSANANR
ncbi:MAG: hypothetical protein KF742_00215 [Cryobacterium sp.]|nr:hypothetical protein [Cryobacterium sp.]MCO5293807.1 hypothetical protein [Homoserinimonas sp.]